jgi:predicted DNA-binding transcriptional regulator AlpA
MKHIINLLELILEAVSKQYLNHKKVFNVADFCLYTGLSKSQVYKITSRSQIDYSKTGGKIAFFEKSVVDEYLLQNCKDSCKVIDTKAANYNLRKAS